MKTTVTVTPKEAEKDISYPYWGKAGNGDIVFFEAKNTGTRHNGNCGYWKYMDLWDESMFTPIIGTITITQE